MNKALQLMSGLFADSKDGLTSLSVGRTAFIVVLALALWKWYGGSDIPGTQETVLMALLAYNFSTKGVNAYKDIKTAATQEPLPDQPV